MTEERSICEGCHECPSVTTITLDDEPTPLCQDCLYDIAGVLEEENE